MRPLLRLKQCALCKEITSYFAKYSQIEYKVPQMAAFFAWSGTGSPTRSRLRRLGIGPASSARASAPV